MNKYMDCSSSYDEAELVLISYPYDGTSSFRPGSRFAPSAIRDASYALESYSPYLDLDIRDLKVCDKGDLLLPFSSSEKVIDIISGQSRKLLNDSKKILSLGGEHLISYPIIKEYLKLYPSLLIFHFDAHADLRNSYLGEYLSHATVMRRVFDLVGDGRIYQFGIRSGTAEEFSFARKHCNFHPFDVNKAGDILSSISPKIPIYITIDLDILDPSVLPGTGTPEPGGISFLSLLSSLHSFRFKNVVGIDIVELSPDYDTSGVSSIVAAKLVRECLLLL